MEPQQEAFTELKRCPQRSSTFVYPDSSSMYYLLTDTSKCLGATLYQYTSKSDSLDNLKPTTVITGKEIDTQYNYGAFTREAFATYMSISFYLQHVKYIILYDH